MTVVWRHTLGIYSSQVCDNGANDMIVALTSPESQCFSPPQSSMIQLPFLIIVVLLAESCRHWNKLTEIHYEAASAPRGWGEGWGRRKGGEFSHDITLTSHSHHFCFKPCEEPSLPRRDDDTCRTRLPARPNVSPSLYLDGGNKGW